MYFFSMNFVFTKYANEVLLKNTTKPYFIIVTSYQTLTTGNVSSSASAFGYFSKNSKIYLSINYLPSSISGTVNKTASWLMFKYETDHYCYASKKSGTNTNSSQIIHYLSINEMRGIEVFNKKKFKIKMDGIYYINLGISTTKDRFKMECLVNNQVIYESIIFREKNFAYDSLSKAFAQYFKVNDLFWCRVSEGTLLSFSRSSLTILRLEASIRRPIISIATELDYDSTSHSNSIPFKKLFAYEGNFWDSLTHIYHIKVSGIYFMYLGVGSAPNERVYIEIFINKKVYATLERTEYNRDSDVVSRTLLMKLNLNDEIDFKFIQNSGFKSKYFTTNFIMFFVSN